MIFDTQIALLPDYLRSLLTPPPIVRTVKPKPAIAPTPQYTVYRERAMASWYGDKENGNPTASGEIFNMYHLTAAHNHLKFGTRVRVTNLINGKEVIVRINDTGGFTPLGREIDLSYEAARLIGGIEAGVFPVKLELVHS